MSNKANPTEWLLNGAWKYFWDKSQKYYIPDRIPDSYSIPDDQELHNIDATMSIPGACGSGANNNNVPSGDATLDLTNVVVSGLKVIQPGGPLQFISGTDDKLDAQVKISFNLSSLTAKGDWLVTQECMSTSACSVASAGRLLDALQDDLDPFYQVQKDLEKGAPGSKAEWYLHLYSRYSSVVAQLLNQNTDVKSHWQYDHGPSIWHAIVTAVSSAQEGKPIQMPGNDVQNQVFDFLSTLMMVSPDLATVIQQVWPDIEWCEGKTYPEFLNKALTEHAPPANGEHHSGAAAARAASSGDTFSTTENGSFTDSLSDISTTLTCDLLSEDQKPKVNVSKVELTIKNIHFKIEDSILIDWLENWIANGFLKNTVIGKLEDKANDAKARKKITDGLNQGLQIFWQSLP